MKTVKIIMLSKEHHDGMYTKHVCKIHLSKKLMYTSWSETALTIPQHVYFISDDPIKVGDWFYHNVINKVVKANSADISNIDYLFKRNKYAQKVVASTDASLKLPTIPVNWLRDVYVLSNDRITQVNLLTELNYNSLSTKRVLKVNKNNEVIIVSNTKNETITTYYVDENTGLKNAFKNWYLNKTEFERMGFGGNNISNLDCTILEDAFTAGANWQKQQKLKENE